MKKFTSLLIGCSLALAGAAMAQQPDQQQTPRKKQAAETTHPDQAQPGATQQRPRRQTGAMNQPGAPNEPGAGKGRKARVNQESATAPGTEGGVSGQPTGGATTEPGAAKGRKGRAKSETAAQTGTDVSGQPTGGATPGAEQPRKGMRGRAAKTSATRAATGAVSANPAAA